MKTKETKFRKKPVVIDAFQLHYNNLGSLKKWVTSLGDDFDKHFNEMDQGPEGANLSVNTLEGTSYNTKPLDWIIRGVNGEYYPCKPDIFEKTYEPFRPFSSSGEAAPTETEVRVPTAWLISDEEIEQMVKDRFSRGLTGVDYANAPDKELIDRSTVAEIKHCKWMRSEMLRRSSGAAVTAEEIEALEGKDDSQTLNQK